MAAQTLTTPGTSLAVIDISRPARGRREILGDAIAALAGAVIIAGAGITMATPEALSVVDAPAPTGPDAELMTLCESLDDLEREYTRTLGTAKTIEQENAVEPELAWISAAQKPLLDRIVSSAAATPEGVRAKARSLILIGRNYDMESDHTRRAAPRIPVVRSGRLRGAGRGPGDPGIAPPPRLGGRVVKLIRIRPARGASGSHAASPGGRNTVRPAAPRRSRPRAGVPAGRHARGAHC